MQVEETLPDWRGHFVSYKALKKRVKLLPSREMLAFDNSVENQAENKLPFAEMIARGLVQNPHDEMVCRSLRLATSKKGTEFIRVVKREMLKISNFFCDKEEDFAIKVDVRKKLRSSH